MYDTLMKLAYLGIDGPLYSSIAQIEVMPSHILLTLLRYS